MQKLTADYVAGRHRAAEYVELVGDLARRDHKLEAYSETLLTALRTKKDSFELYGLAFQVLHERKQWLALAELAEAAKRTPAMKDKAAPFHSAAHAYAELGDDRNCMENADYLVSFGGDRLSALLSKAHYKIMLGQGRAALKLCEEARKDFPDAPAARRIALIEADAYLRAGEIRKSEGILRDLLADDPDDPLVLNNLGYNLADQNRNLPEAEALIRRAIELDRDHRLRVSGSADAESGNYQDSLGWVLFRRGEFEKAAAALAKAVDSPEVATEPVIWDHYGDTLWRLGKKAEARKAWSTAAKGYESSYQGREQDRLAEARRKAEMQ